MLAYLLIYYLSQIFAFLLLKTNPFWGQRKVSSASTVLHPFKLSQNM